MSFEDFIESELMGVESLFDPEQQLSAVLIDCKSEISPRAGEVDESEPKEASSTCLVD